MKLIVGLGNPGHRYKKTRHNVGWIVINELAKNWKKSKKANCVYSKQGDIEYIKPLTFMNNSGKAVRSVKDKHKIKPENIIVIHDDIDLPFGEIRISKDVSSAGHKGVQSIINELGTQDFTRVRIGINPRLVGEQADRKIDTERFVLEKFTKEENKQLDEIIKQAIETIKRELCQSI
ncbi:MAG TPA: aminoacyl-tRNA hydrolase [bacterium]|nr:aminoacyl-tRNA hydrolase [bacterium]